MNLGQLTIDDAQVLNARGTEWPRMVDIRTPVWWVALDGIPAASAVRLKVYFLTLCVGDREAMGYVGTNSS